MNYKSGILNAVAQVAKALGNRQRLDIIERLAQAPSPVDSLAKAIPLPIANVSQHLQALRRVGLVHATRSGKQMIYQLTDDKTLIAINTLRQLAEEHISDVEKMAKGLFSQDEASQQLDTINKEELLAGIANNTLTLIDVRPLNEFKFGHIPGAINAPIDELESIITKLPRSAEIVAYCRGPYCTFSHQSVLMLTKLGYSIRRYDEGLPQWRAYGLPVEAE